MCRKRAATPPRMMSASTCPRTRAVAMPLRLRDKLISPRTGKPLQAHQKQFFVVMRLIRQLATTSSLTSPAYTRTGFWLLRTTPTRKLQVKACLPVPWTSRPCRVSKQAVQIVIPLTPRTARPSQPWAAALIPLLLEEKTVGKQMAIKPFRAWQTSTAKEFTYILRLPTYAIAVRAATSI